VKKLPGRVLGTCCSDTVSCSLALFHSRNMKFVQNFPLQHVARSSTSWDTLQGQILHKFSPATCPVSVYLTRLCPRYILQQHVHATCPLVWAHLHEKKVLSFPPKVFAPNLQVHLHNSINLGDNWIFIGLISNGNRTEWSTIRSVIISDVKIVRQRSAGSPICLIRILLQAELDDTKSYYQLIIKITISKKTK